MRLLPAAFLLFFAPAVARADEPAGEKRREDADPQTMAQLASAGYTEPAGGGENRERKERKDTQVAGMTFPREPGESEDEHERRSARLNMEMMQSSMGPEIESEQERRDRRERDDTSVYPQTNGASTPGVEEQGRRRTQRRMRIEEPGE